MDSKLSCSHFEICLGITARQSFFSSLFSLFHCIQASSSLLILVLGYTEMNLLNKSFGLSDLSMGMSSDYLEASKNSATYLRIGSSIFGERI